MSRKRVSILTSESSRNVRNNNWGRPQNLTGRRIDGTFTDSKPVFPAFPNLQNNEVSNTEITPETNLVLLRSRLRVRQKEIQDWLIQIQAYQKNYALPTHDKEIIAEKVKIRVKEANKIAMSLLEVNSRLKRRKN